MFPSLRDVNSASVNWAMTVLGSDPINRSETQNGHVGLLTLQSSALTLGHRGLGSGAACVVPTPKEPIHSASEMESFQS